jgi:hypothetical protein
MKLKIILTIYILLSIIASEINANEIVEGVYIGWKKISDLSPYDKGEVWYHEHKLVVKGNEIKINAFPRVIKNGRLNYSASDGGFYTYEGKIYNDNNKKPYVKLKVINCDYCPVPVSGKWPENNYSIVIENEVTFVFGSVRYVLQEAK